MSVALVCQIDFLMSFAALTGQKIEAADGPDSFNVLPALLGESKSGRDHLVEHAGVLSLRQGHWKYIEPGEGPKLFANTNTETGNDPDSQLFNLDEDPGETNNLASEQLTRLKEMSALVQKLREQGRSR